MIFSEADYLYTGYHSNRKNGVRNHTWHTWTRTSICDSAPTTRISKLQIHHTVTRPMHCWKLGCSRAQTTQATESHARESGSWGMGGTQNIPCTTDPQSQVGSLMQPWEQSTPSAAPAPNLHRKGWIPPCLGSTRGKAVPVKHRDKKLPKFQLFFPGIHALPEILITSAGMGLCLSSSFLQLAQTHRGSSRAQPGWITAQLGLRKKGLNVDGSCTSVSDHSRMVWVGKGL